MLFTSGKHRPERGVTSALLYFRSGQLKNKAFSKLKIIYHRWTHLIIFTSRTIKQLVKINSRLLAYVVFPYFRSVATRHVTAVSLWSWAQLTGGSSSQVSAVHVAASSAAVVVVLFGLVRDAVVNHWLKNGAVRVGHRRGRAGDAAASPRTRRQTPERWKKHTCS